MKKLIKKAEKIPFKAKDKLTKAWNWIKYQIDHAESLQPSRMRYANQNDFSEPQTEEKGPKIWKTYPPKINN